MGQAGVAGVGGACGAVVGCRRDAALPPVWSAPQMPARGLQLLLLPLACSQTPLLPLQPAAPSAAAALSPPQGWPVLWNADWPSQCDEPTLRSLDLAALGVRTNPGNAMNGSELPALPACAS